MDEFYVYLISDRSASINENVMEEVPCRPIDVPCAPTFLTPESQNHASSWITKLSNPLRLQSCLLVALSELIFPKTMYNVGDGTWVDFITEFDEVAESMKIAPGLYENVEKLNRQIITMTHNMRVSKSQTGGRWEILRAPLITTSETTGRLIVKPGMVNHYIEDDRSSKERKLVKKIYPIFKGELARKLGLEELKRDVSRPGDLLSRMKNGEILYGTEPINLFSNTILVHCDAVQNSYVGPELNGILAIVHMPDDVAVGQMVSIKPEKLVYTPARCDELKNITMELKDSTGKNIEFTSGRTIAVLHFKKPNV